ARHIRKAETASGEHHRGGARQGSGETRRGGGDEGMMKRANHFIGTSAVKLAVFGIAGLLALAVSLPAAAQEGGEHAETPHYPLIKPERLSWSFSGFFGRFDPAQLQRGFQVYREVCASCHGLELVAFRHLGLEGGPNFSED